MSLFKHGRYSGYLRPISYLIDLSIINGFAIFYFFKNIDPIIFITFTTISWITLSVYSKFYEVYRYTREVKIFSLTFRQMVIFTLIIFSFSGYYYNLNIYPNTIFKYIIAVFLSITFVKFAIYYLLQKYRVSFGGNFRKTVIFGANKKTHALENFFNKNPEYGYVHSKTFSLEQKKDIDLEPYFQYIIDEYVDEIYCSISELSNKQIDEISDFADNNLKILKFLPDNKEIYSKKLKYEYYDYIPIISLRNIPLEDSFNMVVKRMFDILFSSLVIIFILSWLTPIIAILIKLESKGPVFFKQSRNGFNYKEFDCYKFRSMTPNKDAHLYQATRGDQRITKIGKLIRKTSIDELPQFFNVLFGDMSVVGPRPHMVSHTNMYAKRVDKFMVRHFVKPGITGLAQVSGFRGEIETDKDIIGRVKYDIFYIENWSLLLDLKIITQTFVNAVKGEDKAY
ncbi:putative colanic acid biosysnthesis UDP-glucose lipid carrier transferase [Formosa sp. Hel1_31_208]|uniref:undecaprenyl-phosphate glucose phosphotransferase n=1 Tax=Formosa sp. Hel1_31_208 TaxID=1798225 RepID=UPI00087AF72B|nr:undecaprenyl-phosphate glucose phosphotransferase [Formosa sp. Hel1_31_208]SDR75594.1 putative colanic acid biosysnthesis UDP-glucose lipid carrier transferase [Formosa sp. Hel1_31_208]